MANTTIVDINRNHKQEVVHRTVPFNIEAEQAVLGALLINNEAIAKIADFLLAEHFYEPVHRRIFEAITKYIDRGVVATPITLKGHFEKDEALNGIGGGEYLIRLTSMTMAIINIEDYARLVLDLATRRQLIHLGEDVVNHAYDSHLDTTPRQQIEQAEQQLFKLASQGVTDRGFVPLKTSLTQAMESADKAHKRKEKLSGVSTGFYELDHLLGGLQRSDLLILAGRPSMGKTAVSVNVAMNACRYLVKNAEDQHQLPAVGFFSLEMSAEQLAARMIAMESGVDSSRMRVGSLTDEEFVKVVQSNKVLHQMPFFIDDTPALSISALRTRARRLKRRHHLALLIIDYLQLLKGTSRQSESNRVQEVSEITQGLKAIAKELEIPVIALSQLSRAVEQREDKRPQLSDLRESGTIEQDADVVMFLFREEYYVARQRPADASAKFGDWQALMDECMNKTEIIIAKQRNGPIGNVKLYFNATTTKFENLAQNTSEVRR